MLADGVEGASRALAEPTPSRVRGLVSRIVDERVQQGQMDECGLTLQDLARVREAFFPCSPPSSTCARRIPRRPSRAAAPKRRGASRAETPDLSAPGR